MRVHARYRRVSDLPLAVRFAVLCVGLSALLAIGLTWLGYTRARQGLSEQAQATLAADARSVADAIDQWHRTRIDSLMTLARLQSARRVLANDAPDAPDVENALDALRAVDLTENVLDSVGLVNHQGRNVLDSDAKGQGTDLSFRDYFLAPMKGQPSFITSITVSVITNQAVLFHSVPANGDDGRPMGIVRSRAALTDITRLVEAAQGRAGAGALGLLLDEYGLVIATTADPGWVGRPIVPLTAETSAALNKAKRWGASPEPPDLGETDLATVVGVREQRDLSWTSGGVQYHALAVPLQSTRWTYVTALPVATFGAAATAFLKAAIVAAIVGLVVSCAVTVLFSRQISRDLGAIAAAARALARGDVDQRVDIVGRDELGQMADAFRSTIEYQREASGVAQAVASGDLTRSIEPKSEHDALGHGLRTMTESLRALLHEVQSSTDRVAANSKYLSDASAHAGQAVQQVAVAVQQLARESDESAQATLGAQQAVRELHQSIDGVASDTVEQAHATTDTTQTIETVASEIDRMAADARTIAEAGRQAQASAESGAEALRATVNDMGEIAQVVEAASARVRDLGALGERIGGVVETIDDVAEQTNLLALNAAIEAARAGEHGRGFAIVADEVRKLAERSQRETRVIGDLVRDVQLGTRQAVEAMAAGTSSVERGVARADETGLALARILDAVSTTVGQIGRVAETAERASAGAHAAAERMQAIRELVERSSTAAEVMAGFSAEVDESVGTMAANAEGATAVAEEVSAAAQEMSAQVEEMTAQAEDLAMTADALRQLVGQFHLGDASEGDGAATPALVSSGPARLSRRQTDWHRAAG